MNIRECAIKNDVVSGKNPNHKTYVANEKLISPIGVGGQAGNQAGGRESNNVARRNYTRLKRNKKKISVCQSLKTRERGRNAPTLGILITIGKMGPSDFRTRNIRQRIIGKKSEQQEENRRRKGSKNVDFYRCSDAQKNPASRTCRNNLRPNQAVQEATKSSNRHPTYREWHERLIFQFIILKNSSGKTNIS